MASRTLDSEGKYFIRTEWMMLLSFLIVFGVHRVVYTKCHLAFGVHREWLGDRKFLDFHYHMYYTKCNLFFGYIESGLETGNS